MTCRTSRSGWYFLAGLAVSIILTLPASAEDSGDLYEPFAALLQDFVAEHDLERDGLVTSFDYRAALAELMMTRYWRG